MLGAKQIDQGPSKRVAIVCPNTSSGPRENVAREVHGTHDDCRLQCFSRSLYAETNADMGLGGPMAFIETQKNQTRGPMT